MNILYYTTVRKRTIKSSMHLRINILFKIIFHHIRIVNTSIKLREIASAMGIFSAVSGFVYIP